MIEVLFSSLMGDLRYSIESNHDALAAVLKRNPNLAYQKVNELATFTGSRYGVELQLHFPVAGKISDVDSYGTENLGIVVDKFRKTFPVPRETVKQKAVELIGRGAKAQDKVTMPEGRIEVLPGSVHFWCKIDDKVKSYGDWLLQNVYLSK
jgi:hypothetical protein